MKNELHLVSFFGQVNENQAFHSLENLQNRQKVLNATALEFGGVSKTESWTLDKLKNTQYYQDNVELLSRSRGCGYWAWKPYIILETLSQVAKNDYVIYCDIGRPHDKSEIDYGNQITCSLMPLVEWAEQNNGMFPGVYLPHHGSASKWIKADCFSLMGCVDPYFQEIPTVQAGYSVWKNSPHVVSFLKKWQQLNLDSRLISDDENVLPLKNSKDFIRHCHDQATLTLLCEKEKVLAFGDKKFQFWGFRNINFISKRASLELKKKSNTLTFPYLNQQNNYLPKFLNQWIELIFCDRTLEPLNLLMLGCNEQNARCWKQYLPNSVVKIEYEQNDFKHYDLITTIEMAKESYDAKLFITIFNLLSYGGIAVIGPLPSSGSTLEEYASKVSKHEEFLISDDIDNSIIPSENVKVHNSRNPIFLRSGSTTFILMYKPQTIRTVKNDGI